MKREPTLVYRAGIIPYTINHYNEVEMLFMRPLDSQFGGDSYQISKGKLDTEDECEEFTTDEEVFRHAAIREGIEELGLLKSNISSVELVGPFLGRTMVYVAKIKNKDAFGMPSTLETESVKWMTMRQFAEDGRQLHVPVVAASYRKILELEQMD